MLLTPPRCGEHYKGPLVYLCTPAARLCTVRCFCHFLKCCVTCIYHYICLCSLLYSLFMDFILDVNSSTACSCVQPIKHIHGLIDSTEDPTTPIRLQRSTRQKRHASHSFFLYPPALLTSKKASLRFECVRVSARWRRLGGPHHISVR